MYMPRIHSDRLLLNDQLHARTPVALQAPVRASHLALFTDWPLRASDTEPLARLAKRYDVPPPEDSADHYHADFGPFRVQWERHTEFMRYSFIVDGADKDAFSDPAIHAVPADWVKELPGQIIVANHTTLLQECSDTIDPNAIAVRLFNGNDLIGASVASGAAIALTDYRIHDDDFGRKLIIDNGMNPWQASRLVQRLFEIDVYRIMALLAQPVANELMPFLIRAERELSDVTNYMTRATERDEPILMELLTRLDASIESRYADNHSRFAASAVYYDLVRWRIRELRETRIDDLQTLQDFTNRRLAPAMTSVRAAAARQEDLSKQVARATHLLSTRIDLTSKGQTQKVLASMNRRAKLQLRLQETLEGLSIAAISYYTIGLISYGAKGLAPFNLNVDAKLLVGLSAPVVVLLVWLTVQYLRKMTIREEGAETELSESVIDMKKS